MSLFVASLNSGSNGNCYYIGNADEAVLVDVGISCREVEKRMARLDLPMNKVKAVFISHEHSDHIRGLETLAKKHDLPVYITPQTLQNGGLTVQNAQPFKAFLPVQIGSISVTAFPKKHDAIDPHSFVLTCNQVNVGVFTDIGKACDHVIQQFKRCNAIFLETNYCEQMLEIGRYPYHLKRRIRSGYGHLSNAQALEIFKKHKPVFMSHVFLSHLSKDNNCPELAQAMFAEHAGKTAIILASRYVETDVYHIAAWNEKPVIPTKRMLQATQYSLF